MLFHSTNPFLPSDVIEYTTLGKPFLFVVSLSKLIPIFSATLREANVFGIHQGN